MYQGTNRISKLDPSILLKSIDLGTNEEVEIRRQLSAMYMALFNFWAAIEYYQVGNNGGGISLEPDDFRELDFDKKMVAMAKSREIQYLAFSRNASEHRLKNPAENIIFMGVKPNQRSHNLMIDNTRLNRSYQCFADLIKAIKATYNVP